MVFDSPNNQITSGDLNLLNSSILNSSQIISIASPSPAPSTTIATSTTTAISTNSTATGTLATTAASLITPSTLTPISPSNHTTSTSVFDSICELTNKNLIFFQDQIDEEKSNSKKMLLENLTNITPTTNNIESNASNLSLSSGVTSSASSPGAEMPTISFKPKQKHPYIKHRPTIHPHNHYQRLNHLNLKTSENCVTSSILVNSEQTNLANATTPPATKIEPIFSVNTDETTANENNHLEIESEASKIDNKIKHIQELIDKLNSEIFKNPRNCTRPPSEYLDTYNTFTEELHNLQITKQKLDAQNDLNPNDTNNNTNINSDSSNFSNQTSSNYNFNGNNNSFNDSEASLNDKNYSSDPCKSPSPVLNSPNKSDDSDQQIFSPNTQNMRSSSSNSSISNSNKVEISDSKKPPLPKTTSNGPPRLKLDHPNTLPTKPLLNTSATNSLIAPSPSSPLAVLNERPPYLDLTESTASSLPMSIINPNLNYQQQNSSSNTNNSSNQSMSHNSRSFNDINDAILAPVMIGINSASAVANSVTNAKQTPAITSFSPPSSIATTPTHQTTFSSPFLRIYIGTSTAVIEKKSVPLQEVLYNKLKSRNLEVDKCIAYIKESCMKIEWDVEVSKIVADNIVVAELSEENQHSFEKKSFTIKSCDSCRKRFLLNVYSCSKCDYIMCQRNECRSKSERIVCVPRRPTAIISTPTQSSYNRQDILDNNYRPDSPIRETAINISQQILPVNQLKVSIPSRDRSRSETELNVFVNSKLTESNRPVPNKSNLSANMYSTLPRKPSYIPNHSSTNASIGISGSINEESGSVITSIRVNPTDSVLARETNYEQEKIPKLPLHKTSRRDSFNVWEIPYNQIKIDMSRKVGSGSFGIVHQGHDFYHGLVAIKFLNVQNPTPSQSNAFRNEVIILKSTRHDNILLFIGCILKPYLAIVTEWCPGSSLYRHIHVEEEYWEMNQIIDIAKQTATGMEYLHARDILHRDLKSNNIFLIPKETNNYRQRQRYYHPQQFQTNGTNAFDLNFMNESEVDKWTVKIGDFGLATAKSTWTQSSTKTNQPTGSILWMAPEVITQKVPDPYTQKSDVYSYAVVLYELVTGNLPYAKREQNMILFLVGSGRLKLDPDDSRKETPKEIKDLIQICSEYDRNKRLDFVEINTKLKNIRPVKLKSKIQRSQSAPNISFANSSTEFSYLSGLSFYDDDFYPGTPRVELFNRPPVLSPSAQVSNTNLFDTYNDQLN